MSFVRYGCLKDVFCILMDVFFTLKNRYFANSNDIYGRLIIYSDKIVIECSINRNEKLSVPEVKKTK